MDSGLASLLGALVGGLVGGAASLFGAAYAEKSQRGREREARATERHDRAVIAARIVEGDLAWAEARVDEALSQGKYWGERYALRDDSWQQYRESIALSLDNADDWSVVHETFRDIRLLELQAGRRRSEETPRPPLTEGGRHQAALGREQIRRARTVLDRIAGKRSSTEAIPEN